MFSGLDQNLTHHTHLSPHELETVHSFFKHKTVEKKTVLLRQGQVCNFEAYLIKGCVKKYYIDQNGVEVILQFAVEDWWASDIASFCEQVPSNLFIETMEETEMLTINHQSKEELFKQLPQLERVFRLMVQRAYAVLEGRFFASVSASAEERYLNFIQHYSTIPQRVQQYQIASYLGITPEALSRIKAAVSRKK